MQEAAQLFANAGALRRDIDADIAADLMCLYNDPPLYDKLVRQRGWSVAQFQTWLTEALKFNCSERRQRMTSPDDPLGTPPSEQLGRFDAMYDAGPPPWDIGRPQPAFAELAERGLWSGRLLDAGCGTGEHTLLAAHLALDATGIDGAPNAIRHARRKAADRDLSARFLVWDALRLTELGEQFDTVVDSGLFHVFDDENRARYVAALAAVIPADGRFYLLCFSDRVPGTLGPRRVSQEEIRATFPPPEWRIDAIDAVTIDTNMDDIGVRAWRVSITRLR